jgi:hypothetical protein
MTKGTYNYDNLIIYCKNNNVHLLKDYLNTKVTRDSIITGRCNNLNCDGIFNKTFRQLKRSSSYCELCTKNNKKIKVENTCLNRYGTKTVFECKEMREIMINSIKKNTV